jgi:hypothetical protein
VYLRSLLYFSTLIATLVFVIFPLAGRSDPLGARTNALKWLSDIIRTLGGFLPSWAPQWFVSYAQYPTTFVILVALIGALLWGSGRVAATIQDWPVP